jgi:hypothetical protein
VAVAEAVRLGVGAAAASPSIKLNARLDLGWLGPYIGPPFAGLPRETPAGA